MELDDAALVEGAERLAELLPLARLDAERGIGRILPPEPEMLQAAQALVAGGGLVLLLHEADDGWIAELLLDLGDAEAAMTVSTPAGEAADTAAAARAGQAMLAGLLMLGAPKPSRLPGFLLHGWVIPLDQEALPSPADVALTSEEDLRRELDRVVSDDFPDGVRPSAVAAASTEARRRLTATVHRAAASGLYKHPFP